MKRGIIISFFAVFLIMACQEPEHGYCSFTFYEPTIEESPTLETIVLDSTLQVICSFGGMDMLDTIIGLSSTKITQFWDEIENQKLKTYYKDGPEWQAKQTNLLEINKVEYYTLKKLVFVVSPSAKVLIEEAVLKAKKIIPSSVPQIIAPKENVDSLSAD